MRYLLLGFFVVAASAVYGNLPADVIARVDAAAASELAREPVGGVTVGLVDGAKLVWTKNYGFADAEKKIPPSDETVYRIGSITKQFTAVMLLQLARDHKLSLNDPVDRYLPEFDSVRFPFHDVAPATLYQLATHTSGLAREPTPMDLYSHGAVADWEKIARMALTRTKYDYRPGERFLYSNIGYAVLGIALSRVAKLDYTEYIQSKVLVPLGMDKTGFVLSNVELTKVARGYVKIEDKWDWSAADQDTQDGRGYRVPNGGLFSTVIDLAKFASFELGQSPKELLTAEELKENQESCHYVFSAPSIFYGVGLMRYHHRGQDIYGHEGSTAGFISAVYFEPASQRGLIVLRNVTGKGFRMSMLMRAAFFLGPPLESGPS